VQAPTLPHKESFFKEARRQWRSLFKRLGSFWSSRKYSGSLPQSRSPYSIRDFIFQKRRRAAQNVNGFTPPIIPHPLFKVAKLSTRGENREAFLFPSLLFNRDLNFTTYILLFSPFLIGCLEPSFFPYDRPLGDQKMSFLE